MARIYMISVPTSADETVDRPTLEQYEGGKFTREEIIGHIGPWGKIQTLSEFTTDLNDEAYPLEEWVAWVYIDE